MLRSTMQITFWNPSPWRGRELAPALEALLGVQHVWCDMRSQESSQRFVLWAGYVLDSRCAPRTCHCTSIWLSTVCHSLAVSYCLNMQAICQ